jgi:hypothetical protein
MTSNRGDEDVHPRIRGWESHGYPSRLPAAQRLSDYWGVALVEGGAVAERFKTRQDEDTCDLEIRLAMPRGESTVRFAFLGPPISVGLVGDYERIPESSTSSFDRGLIRHFAVMASQRSESGLTEQFLTNVVLGGEAARLARDVTLAEGYTLSSPSTLRRFELVEGKVIVIAAYNPSDDQTYGLAFRRSDDDLLWCPCRSTRDNGSPLSRWQTLGEGTTPLGLGLVGRSAAKVWAKWSYSHPEALEVMILSSP